MPKKKIKNKREEIEDEQEEPENLEEKVKEEIFLEEIDSEELQEFLSFSSSPILGQVAIAPRENTQIIPLEQSIRNSPLNPSTSEEDFKYNISNKEEGPKYTSDKEIAGPGRVDTLNLGRNQSFLPQGEVSFVNSYPTDTNKNSIERYAVPEKIEIEKLKTPKFNERFGEVERKKYEPLH